MAVLLLLAAVFNINGLALNFTNPLENKSNQTLVIFDGRQIEDESEEEASAAEKELVWQEFKKSESAIKEKFGDQYCSDEVTEPVEIYATAEGSFTKPGAAQKIFLYFTCDIARGFGIGGIMIAEENLIVAHYVEQVSWGETIRALPDINQDGLNEILLSSGGSGQGYTTMFVDILDFPDGKLNYWGQTETLSSNGGAEEDEAKILATAYKISVEPGNEPAFYRETYEQKGNDDEWKLIKKTEKFTLELVETDWKEIS